MSSPAELDPPPAAGRLNAVQWRVVLLLMAFAFLCHFNRVGMSVAGTERLMKEFRFDEEQMGLVYSSYLFVYTILMIPGGWLIDRYGPRAALAAMGGASAGLVMLTGLPAWGLVPVAAALPVFMAIRGFLGMATVPMHPGAARMISLSIHPGSRIWGNGMVTGAALVGVASTYYLFGFLMDRVGWSEAFLCSGLATAVVTTLWMMNNALNSTVAHSANVWPTLAADESPAVPSQRNTGVAAPTKIGGFTEMLPLFRDRNLILVTLSYAAAGYFQYLFFYWMEYYFREILGVSKDEGRLYTTIPNLAMAFGMISGGHLSDRLQVAYGIRWGRAAMPIAGMTCCAIFAVAGVHLHEPVSVVICFALAMGVLGLAEGAFWTTAVELGGRRGGMSGAIFNAGGNAGGTLAPYITPLFSKHFGWQAGIELACLFCVMGAVLWFWIKPTEDAQM